MLCQICKKKEASIHIQEFANGGKKAWHLCEECAMKKGFAGASQALDGPKLQQMLQQIVQTISGEMPEMEEEKLPDFHCPECGWDRKQFEKTKHLGCPECYKVFGAVLRKMRLTDHHGTIHTGKIPDPPKISESDHQALREQVEKHKELERLQRGLDESIRREEYEFAAELRDKIATLKKELNLK